MTHWPSQNLKESILELPNDFRDLEKVLVENAHHSVMELSTPSLRLYDPIENVLPPEVSVRSYSVKNGEVLFTPDDLEYLGVNQNDSVMVNYEVEVRRVEIIGEKTFRNKLLEHYSY